MQIEQPGVADALSFEEALAALEEIVSALESGQVSLERAIDLFERGVHLAKMCSDGLEQARLRITQLESVLGRSVIDE